MRPLLVIESCLFACAAMLTAGIAAETPGANGGPKGAPSVIRAGDIIAFVGGEDLVAEADAGYLDLALLQAFPDCHLRFRSLAWEGDTVFEQRRDLNYPSLEQQLDQIGATVVFAQFGKMESLGGPQQLTSFENAYGQLLERLTGGSKRRLVILSPTPFERDIPGAVSALHSIVAAERHLAAEKAAVFVDLTGVSIASQTHMPFSITRDGLHLNEEGLAEMALACAAALAGRTEVGTTEYLRFAMGDGNVALPLHNAVVAKNRLWFHYYRPQNWAFLACDRTNQPSSRDYRDPSKRWFPDEMQQWLPLVAEKEKEIEQLSQQLKN